MKKQKYIIILLVSVLFSFTFINFVKAQDYLEICAEREGWTKRSVLYFSVKTDFGVDENPAEYYSTLFKILRCYRDSQPVPSAEHPRKNSWLNFTSILNLARTSGVVMDGNRTQCQGEGFNNCDKTSLQCQKNCSEIEIREGYVKAKPCYDSCSIENIKCYATIEVKCENEVEAAVMAWAGKLKVEIDREVPKRIEDEKLIDDDGEDETIEKICEPKETKCIDDYFWRCVSDGSRWESTKCLMGCDPGTSQCREVGELSVTISPDKVRLPADGKSTQEFVLKATADGAPLKNERFTVVMWTPFWIDYEARVKAEDVLNNFGTINAKTITTDASGRASFVYTAPMASQRVYFENLSFQIKVEGVRENKIEITLIDPKPRITVNLAERSILEGSKPGVNYIDIQIEDEFGKEWDIAVKSNLGKFAVGGREGEFYTLLDKTRTRGYKANWLPPEGVAELVDATMNYVIAHQKDWSNFKTGIKEDSVEFALGEIFLGKPDAQKEFESWKEIYGAWKIDVEVLQENVNQIKSSTSAYERFLRSISMGFRGLQVFYGTKSFVDDKLGEKKPTTDFLDYIKSIRDKTINYGVDSLRSGLNLWADFVREGSLDTRRTSVSIMVEVGNDSGFSVRKSGVFEYIYYTLNK